MANEKRRRAKDAIYLFTRPLPQKQETAKQPKRITADIVLLDGWYVGAINEIPGCRTQGKTVSETLARLAEAYQAATGAK